MPLTIHNDDPWLLGIHYCAQHRQFTGEEILLFKEIAHRLSEAINYYSLVKTLENGDRSQNQLIAGLPIGVIIQDNHGNINTMNSAASELLGIEIDAMSSLPVPGYWGNPVYENGMAVPPSDHPALLSLKKQEVIHNAQVRITNAKNKSYTWVSISSKPLHNSEEFETKQVISTLTDISKLVHTDSAIQTHLNFLNIMERINTITNHSGSIDNMLKNVLDEMLEIFNCERAWFLYPCDPSSPTWNIPIYRYHPDWPWPGDNLNFDMSPPVADTFNKLLAQSTPHAFTVTENTDPLIADDLKKYHIRSQMMMSLHPQTDKPWVLGIHFCQETHQVTKQEKRLFEEIGQRITNALTGLISLQSLQESEERFRTLVENAPEAIFVLDVETKCFIDVNYNAIKLFGKTREELLSLNCVALSPDIQPNGCPSEETGYNYVGQAANGESPVFEWTIQHDSGELIPCEVRLVRLPSRDKILVRGSMTDITDRQRTTAQMHKLSSALEQTADAIMITDTYGEIEYVNPAFEKITGYSFVECIGNRPNILCSGEHNKDFYRNLWQTLKSGKVFNDIIINRRKDGSLYYEEKTISPLFNDQGNITHMISAGRDISVRMEIQEKLHYLAHHDILTKLPNRALFTDRLEQAIAEAKRTNTSAAMLFMDLDHFKMINDTLGHDVGDAAIKLVARLLKETLGNEIPIARFGGDEFAILIGNISDPRDVTKTIQSIFQIFSRSFTIHEHELFLKTSMGITLFPNDGEDSNTLIKNADIAMYRAKELGRNNYEFYSQDLSAKVYQRLSLETKLRRALERGEFLLHYQPLIEISSQQIVAAEVLLRWQPLNEPLQPPASFIPVLEETGLITSVGDWVLLTASEQLKQWNQQLDTPLRLALNISTKQFSAQLVDGSLETIINKIGIHPSLLELEITESLLLDSSPQTIELIQKINKMGFKLSIDDFGTGYSSLSYLKRLPINTLKIDRSFVQDINKDPDNTAIIDVIIALGKSLKLDIVAEGVETEEQLSFLEQQQCSIAQGFYFSKPLAKTEFEQLIFKQKQVVAQ